MTDIKLNNDGGYPPHVKLREVIKTSWEKDHDFDKVLEEAIARVIGGENVIKDR